MKTIEQLLELSNNPFYKFTPDEQAVLNDFLAKKQATRSTPSRKTSSKPSDKNTRVTVRNIVQKTVPRVQEAPEDSESLS